MDDYQVLDYDEQSDKDVFSQYLTTKNGKFKNEAALWNFVVGADQFVTRLSDLFETLSEDESSSYGIFYSYWMAKYFGDELGKRGYVRQHQLVDWSSALINSEY